MSTAETVEVAEPLDVLANCTPEDVPGNIAKLRDAGYSAMDAQAAATLFRLRGSVAQSSFAPAPLALDFDAVPEPPEWVVDRMMERGTVVVFSGDTGAAKSIVSMSLVPAALGGSEWLGRTTAVERVMVVDEENASRLVTSRLRALGVTNDMRDRLRYFSREGVAIGDEGRSDAWLREQLADFKPDVVVIDTLMAACAVEDTNSNSEAVRVMKHLRGLAREFSCVVLLLHHERKQSADKPRSSGQAMMGARQWAGQADAHMTITVESDFTTEAMDDGGETTRRTFKFKPAEKDRDGRSNQTRRIAVTSERDGSGRYAWMKVDDEGPVVDERVQDSVADSILVKLAGASEPRAAAWLATAVGAKSAEDGSFKRALTGLVEQGRAERPKRGHYAITDAGRESVQLPV